ncbi:ABC transporter permease [Roseivirga sp. E12]|uniref:ABC transporter permease n=1 Tax=Roseivirga sp. E12 TaxID=2819237 RepID=UPI001ABC80F1|nr:ABC transporter permease [Roseivirga sp. E12]MBO3700578.1 ABC transporter permease [Roseivirga sp. E12]
MSYKNDMPSPPRIARWFLQLFCTELWLEEIEGDLEEEFALNVKEKGIRKARISYFWTVLRSFRPYILKEKLLSGHNSNKNVMFSNYLKITLRALLKNRVYSFINISGLAIGIAGALLIFHYVSFESSYEKFIQDSDDMYRVSLELYGNGEFVYHSAENYPPVGETMVNDFPEVVEWAHLYNMGAKNNVVITYEESPGEPVKLKHKKFLYASPSTLSMFSAQMVEGDAATALNEPFSIVISESTAKKYFGDESALGKRLRLRDDDFNNENCLVTGVFKDLPANTHLKYDVLISTGTIYGRWDGALTRYKTGWVRKDFYTYVKVRPGTDIKALESKIPEMIDRNMPDLADQNARHVMHLQPLNRIHFDSHLSDESELNGSAEPITFLSIIAIFIVVIAWVNYVNLATSRSLDRAREVGIRKVLGSLRAQLIRQFLFESVIVNLLAVVLALGIVALALPSFYVISGIPDSVVIWQNQSLWLLLGAVFLFGSIVSGFYPAMVLSSFKPVSTLKGKFRNSSTGVLLRKGLVIFQFATSAALIVGTLTVSKQMKYMQSADLGFDLEQTIVVERAAIADTSRTVRNRNLETFQEQLRANANIKSVSSSGMVPGKKIRFKGAVRAYNQQAGQVHPMDAVGGDYGLIETLGMEIIAGRNFSRDFPNDRDTAVLVSRSSVPLLGYDNPEDIINQAVVVENFGATAIVIGVVEDYNHESLRVKAAPSIFLLDPQWAEYFLFRVDGSIPDALAAIERQWSITYSANPFDFFFLDEFFNNQYKSEQQFQAMFSVFSVLAILIGCLGLFGLSAFTAMQKTKEIGIRKVLGASVQGVFYMLSKEFIGLILIANVIAWPIIYFAMDKWLQGFEYRTAIDISVFGLALLAVMAVALLTISFQTIKSARLNPVDSLRYE